MSRTLNGALLHRLLPGVALASAALTWQPPVVSAECMGPGPIGADEIPQVAHAFIANVTEASDDVDPVDDMASYDWHAELSTERTFVGSNPPSLVFNGWDSSCHDFRGESLRTGDRIFVATEGLNAELQPGIPFIGDILVWRWEEGSWAFYADAMSGAEYDGYYPKAARTATTISEILTIVAAGSLPETSTADAVEAKPGQRPPTLPLLLGLIALLLSPRIRWRQPRDIRRC
jgi:hypothetical protein